MSAPIVVEVQPPPISAPIVNITSPPNNSSIGGPARITIVADAVDLDGRITQVEFYQGSTLLGTAIASPYSIVWANVPAGNYILTAKATDDTGASTISLPVSITVESEASLNIMRQGDIIVISWSGGGTLESAPAIDGPWLPVSSPAIPYMEPLAESPKFFRVR
jgi:hypothetical protein